MKFICSPAAGARCWLARPDNGMFCLIPEQPWLCLQLQPCPLNFPGCPEPLIVLLEGNWEGIPLCPTGLVMGIIWSKKSLIWSLGHLLWSSELRAEPLVLTTKPLCLIPNQRCIFSSVLPWVSDISFHRAGAVLIFMSRDMKTKQHQNKYFIFPRKPTHKPLLHTTVCKVQSTHQAATKPSAHTVPGQKPHRIHPGIADSKGNFITAKADSNTRNKYMQSHLYTRVNPTCYRYLFTCFSAGFCR